MKMAFLQPYVILACISAIAINIRADSGPCSNVMDGIVADSDDCAGFFICHGGHEFKFSCASNFGPAKVFDPVSETCVLSGSQYDNSACNKRTTCVPGRVSKTADEGNCARYYQCVGRGYEPLHMECQYPRLYSRVSKRCETYAIVKCDHRAEPKDPCDYEANQCFGSGCVPCRARFGTCIAQPDGPNAWEGKPWTPYFVVCKQERVILNGDCRSKGKVELFNPVTRRCISVAALVRRAMGSHRPKSTGLPVLRKKTV